MKRAAYPPGREEPNLDDPTGFDFETDDYPDRRIAGPPSARSDPPRPGIFRRAGRMLRSLLLLVLLIVALSYLPESWSEQQHPHVQEALRICGDIRDLLYRVGVDIWHWLHSESPLWYQRLHALLPESLSAYLPAPADSDGVM